MSDPISRLSERMDDRFTRIEEILLGDGLSEEGLVNKARKASHDANNARQATVGLDARLKSVEDTQYILVSAHKTRKKIVWLVVSGALTSVGAAAWTWAKAKALGGP